MRNKNDNNISDLVSHGIDIGLGLFTGYVVATSYRSLTITTSYLFFIPILAASATTLAWLYLHNLHNPKKWLAHYQQSNRSTLIAHSLALASLAVLLTFPSSMLSLAVERALIAGIALHAWYYTSKFHPTDSASIAPVKLVDSSAYAGPTNQRFSTGAQLTHTPSRSRKIVSPSRVVANKVHGTFKHFSDLFCQLHHINPRIPPLNRVVEDFTVLKNLHTNQIYHVDTHRLSMWGHLVPEHIYPVHSLGSSLLSRQQKTLDNIEQRLATLLKMYNFIQLSNHYKHQMHTHSAPDNDPMRTPVRTHPVHLQHIFSKASSHTPSPSKFDKAICQDQSLDADSALGFYIILVKSDGKEQLVYTDSSTLETILSPESTCTNQETLLIQNDWSNVSHLSERAWPGTNISLFDPIWEIKRVEIRQTKDPLPRHSLDTNNGFDPVARRLQFPTMSPGTSPFRR